MTSDDFRPWWTPGGAATQEIPAVGPDRPEPPAEPPAKSRRWQRPVVAGLAALVVAAGGGLAGAEIALRTGDEPAAAVSSATTVSGGTEPTETLAKVAAAVAPSVVSVTVESSAGSSEGSGVVIRSDGMILTNNHVVESAVAESTAVESTGGQITVTFDDGETAEAQIVGRDEATDLAVIQAEGVEGLTPATLGSSSTLHVGDTVLAIGSPLGLDGSVSAGIVSALHRPVDIGSDDPQQSPFDQGQSGASGTTLGDAIQTDAPINPGNSGGPLVDTKGRVVGINTAIATLSTGVSGQSGSIGVGFAIPVDEAKKVAESLMKGEQPTHAVLGVQVSDVSSGGARIESLTESGAAADAGLLTGDIVTAVGDVQVDGASTLAAAIRAHQPGDRVRIEYTRDGERRSTTVTLGSAT